MCTYTLTLHQCPHCKYIHDSTSPGPAIQPCSANPRPDCAATPSAETRCDLVCYRCRLLGRGRGRGGRVDDDDDDASGGVDGAAAAEVLGAAEVLERGQGSGDSEKRRGEVREWWRGCFQERGRRQRGEGK
jgi:hypothetical protein